MAAWDCFISFRSTEHKDETPLLKAYADWFLAVAWRRDVSCTSNYSQLLSNLYLLSSLPLEIQNEIFKNERFYNSATFSTSGSLPELFLNRN